MFRSESSLGIVPRIQFNEGFNLGVLLNVIALILPHGVWVSANRYWTENSGVKAFRFEARLGGVKGMLTYGWNGFGGVGKEAWNGPRYTYQLRTCLSVWPAKGQGVMTLDQPRHL